MTKREALAAVAAHLSNELSAMDYSQLTDWVFPTTLISDADEQRIMWAVDEMQSRLGKDSWQALNCE